MKKYTLMDGPHKLTSIFAKTEKHAWNKLKQMGFRNRSKIYNLSCEEDDIYENIY